MNVLITGGTRGIGKAIAIKLASKGANVALMAKTLHAHEKLEGTLITVSEEIKSIGGKPFYRQVDTRDEGQVMEAVPALAYEMGGIDVLINNASAISLTDTVHTTPKRYDLMMDVNVRGAYLTTQAALPFLSKSTKAHIINLSPPIDLNPKWFGSHVAYTLSKYNMSMLILGWAEEFKSLNIAANALWPRTLIATAAIANMPGGEQLLKMARNPQIVADAIEVIVSKPSSFTGQMLIDEDVLRENGVEDFSNYLTTPGTEPLLDLFLD